MTANTGKLCAIGLTAVLAFTTFGCTTMEPGEGSLADMSASETGTGSAENSHTEEGPEEEPVDVAALEAQVIGPWLVTSFMFDGQGANETAVNEIRTQGTLYYGTFNEDGTFSMIIHDFGRNKNPWNGTWSIDEEGLLTMTMENGVFLTTDDIGERMTLQLPSNVQTENGDFKLALKKLTEHELESEIAATDEITPLVAMGDTVETSDYSFTLTSAKIVSEFYPPDTSGYYHYYEAPAGNKYYLVRGTFKNLGSTYADLKFGTEAVFSINDGEYQLGAEVAACRSDSSDFYDYEVGPLDSVELYIFCEISDELADSVSSAELQWNFATSLDTYYDDSNCGARYAIEL